MEQKKESHDAFTKLFMMAGKMMPESMLIDELKNPLQNMRATIQKKTKNILCFIFKC